MAQMASETGGEFYPSSNDMYVGLQTIACQIYRIDAISMTNRYLTSLFNRRS